MRKKTRLVLFIFTLCFSWIQAQVNVCSWNIQNFGKSKSDSSIAFMATLLNSFDVVGIVEVVGGNGGAQAVARLADELNRKGSKWDYCVSDPTVSYPGSTERYAFLWKTSKLKKIGRAWLDTIYKMEIEREPYLASFSDQGKEFTLALIHAVPKSKQPERELKYLKFIPALYPGKNILFCGDFNIAQSHSVFDPLKSMFYKPVLTKQKTTLKNECKGKECLASEYDNIFYDSTKVLLKQAGILEFYKQLPNIRAAHKISDHVPVYAELEMK